MPELPEVETVKRSLAEQIIGLTITGVTVNLVKTIKIPDVSTFKEKVIGKTIRNIRRRGKYLILELSGEDILVVHLRMTGQFTFVTRDEPLKKHTHVIFDIDSGMQLRFVDQRQFGCMWLVTSNEIDQISGLCALGPEPLEEEFTRNKLDKIISGRKTKIKQVLLDQKAIAGIGNIYADEILFHSAIHPERTAASLNDEEIERLFLAIKYVLGEAVKHRGTSFSDYVDGRGEKGSHQNYLNVYQQVGKNCPRCGKSLSRLKVGSRSAYHCPECQK